LISRLTSWIYQQGAAQRHAWRDSFDDQLILSISLSNAQFAMPNLVPELQRAIAMNGLQAQQLEVEVVETSLMHNQEEAMRQLHELHNLGVRVALDDYGTGNCSLKLLRDLPIDTLKLDRHLVARLPESTRDATLARSVIDLCRDFDITVIAEGVETREQYQWLQAHGCELAQGFIVAKPLTSEDATAFPGHFDWSTV